MKKRRWLPHVARALLLASGAGVVALLVRRAGPLELWAAVRPTLPWMPLLLGLDALRVAADAAATFFAYGDAARTVPRGPLIRAQLIANAVTMIAPAGRTAAEATKAALLSSWVGWPRATATATLLQALTLVGGALITVPCVVASALLTGGSAWTFAIAAQGAGVLVMGLVLRAATRSERVGSFLSARGRAIGAGAAEFRQASREPPMVPALPLACVTFGRACQVAQYYVLALAMGADITVPRALLAQGVSMVALALGVLVPGQVGASDGAFALSRGSLGMTAAQALAVPLLVHVLQAVGIAVGAVTPWLWRARRNDQAPQTAGPVDAK